MDSMMVLGSKNLFSESNVKLGSHKFLSSNLAVPVLGNAKTSQISFCSLPSLGSNCSLIALRRGQRQSQHHLNRGVLRSRKVTRNSTCKSRIAETESTTRERERLKDYEIDGKVALEKKFSLLDWRKVYIELLSSDQVDPDTGLGKMAGHLSCLDWGNCTIKFKWNSSLGFPGAFRIKNMRSKEFFLKSLTISIPDQGEVRFHCNSWIFPFSLQPIDRVFFANKVRDILQ